jgi:hypothetical protein
VHGGADGRRTEPDSLRRALAHAHDVPGEVLVGALLEQGQGTVGERPRAVEGRSGHSLERRQLGHEPQGGCRRRLEELELPVLVWLRLIIGLLGLVGPG